MAKALQDRHFQLTGERLTGGMDPAAAAAAFAGCLGLAAAGERTVAVAALAAAATAPSPVVLPGGADEADEPAASPAASPSPLPTSEPFRTDLERTIARVWAEALHLSRVGRSDNFFDLGGDSLVGLQITRRLRLLLGRNLTIRTLFASPTPQGLAEAIAVVADAEAVPEVTPTARLTLDEVRRRRADQSTTDR
jgi:hypothetical protein